VAAAAEISQYGIPAAIAVAAISVTIARGSIFAGFREWLGRWPWVQKLFSCAWCLSHWVATFIVLVTGHRPVLIAGKPGWSWFLSTMFMVAVAWPFTVMTIALVNRTGALDNEERRRLRLLLKEATAKIRELENEQEDHTSA
jgi:hypothetical protein